MLPHSIHSLDPIGDGFGKAGVCVAALDTEQVGKIAEILSSNLQENSMLDESAGRRGCSAARIQSFRCVVGVLDVEQGGAKI